MDAIELSCADCGAKACCNADGPLPPFCTTTALEPGELEEALALSNHPENQAVLHSAAQVEYEGYCKMTRVEEIMAFARRVGLLKESHALARILRANGFQVYAVACKAGRVDKSAVGIDEACKAVGVNMCNPILQARHLNRLGTELNIVVGLCVGHDSMFYKYAEGLTTTLIAKDRVTGHNPAAVLYNLDSYYKRLLTPPSSGET